MTKRIITALILISVSASVTLAGSGFPRSSLEHLRRVRRGVEEVDPTTEDLIRYWSMREDDGTVFDETGNNDLTVSGTITFDSAYGVRNDGARFDGSSGYMAYSLGEYAAITITAWFRTSFSGVRQNIITSTKSDGTRGFKIRLGDDGKLSTYYRSEDADNFFADDTNYADGEWHFLVLILTDTYGQLIINDTIIDTIQNGFFHDDGWDNAQRIGVDRTLHYWNGDLDEMRIYTRVPTTEELTELYEWDKP